MIGTETTGIEDRINTLSVEVLEVEAAVDMAAMNAERVKACHN